MLGYACGILTLTPYYFWKRTHARHHVSSGDLGHRGQGDVGVLTVDEYRCRSRFGRLRYRLYRNPIVMFALGAGFLFLIRQRFTFSIPRSWRRERLSVHATNGGIFAMIAARLVHDRLANIFFNPYSDRHSCRGDRQLAVFRPASIRSTPIGSRMSPGSLLVQRSTVVRTIAFRAYCNGSPATSAFTISITLTAEFLTTTCQLAMQHNPPSSRR